EEVIARAHDHGIARMNVVGCDWESSMKAVEIAESHEGIYAVVGVHPGDADTYCDELEDALRAWAGHEKVVAIGEIGLDYHYDDNPAKEVQDVVFRRQIRLARETGLPIVIHSRDAMEDTLRILKDERREGDYRGIFHCFSGSYEQSLICLKMGFHISVGGPLTYPNSRKLPGIVEKIPLDRLLVETDCPYLSPQPRRGKRNEPANVRFVAERIAELREISPEEVAEKTTANALRLFHLNDNR
ncbi:MAG: TatD family hydrolase, partial [Bacillota bacterium]|nr:TatD family hydrolase [Bacillota bacterium]